MKRIACGLTFTVATLILGVPALSQDEDCTACHEDTKVDQSVHGIFECADCHSNVGEFPHDETQLAELSGNQICAQCHDDALTQLEAGIHAELLECSTCHGAPHEIRQNKDLASPMSPLKQIQVCSQCHDTNGLMDGYLGSVHGRGLVVSGLINAPSCSDCHGEHLVHASDDAESKVSRLHVPETCGVCHAYVLETWKNESAHGELWEQGQEGPVCSTCHGSHQVGEPRDTTQRLRFPEDCGSCHSEEYRTYRDTFHGQVTSLGFRTAATCSDCHTPHKNLPATDPRSTIHPTNLAVTCGACHENISSSFLSYDPHIDPSDPNGDWRIHYIWFAMTALLISVFGFFGLHDLLWLQRSIVAVTRGEISTRVNSREGPWIRRFSPLEVGIHISIILSFLTLAATGLPLRYHESEWARAISVFLGGVEGTRLLHRLAAIVTFGYGITHIVHLVRRIFQRKDFGVLWGWRSMVPRQADLKDFWSNIRYFLYAGPRPQLDRWTYWEKFDYFAVFWGIIIIGSSGAALWFPSLFTQILPGWMLNVAHVVHGDEALLAVGFIFVFHFFHTHLRPESFPLDPVIFTGLVRLERFKEEREIEYQRLVDSGKLEERLVDGGPSRRLMARIYFFGFAAVAIGIALMIGILTAFLSG